MFAVIVNTLSVCIGSCLGLLFKKSIPEKIADTLMKGLGLCTLYIGWSGTLEGKNPLVLILSMVLGIIIGEGLDLDKALNSFAQGIEKRFQKDKAGVSVAEGFVTASILFCIGAMTLVGALQAGLTGNYDMLMTKSMLDFVSSLIFSSMLGIGVLLSAAFVFLFEGAIVLVAQYVEPFLSELVIAEMTCVGSLLIFGIGLNILGISKLKLMNFLPAIFLPILLSPLLGLIL